jgi:hypothetical protein
MIFQVQEDENRCAIPVVQPLFERLGGAARITQLSALTDSGKTLLRSWIAPLNDVRSNYARAALRLW